MVSSQTVINIMEKLAPKKLAMEWDNPGLAVGDFAGKVSKILVALTVTPEVVHYAAESGFNMIISHHPMFFKPIKALRKDLPLGRMVYEAVKHDITIYSTHTNLDITENGVNDEMARVLDLEDIRVLKQTAEEPLKKIVVFVPRGYEDAVRNAMAEAGAGFIGNYSHCSFNIEGKGTFKPEKGADPFIGEEGKLERVDEVRIETIAPENFVRKIISAMLRVHPYEEVAYDIYPLENTGKIIGLGRVGKLRKRVSLKELCETVKMKLSADYVKVSGDLHKEISTVAVCGGAGGDLISAASFAGADVLITGDVKYHDALDAKAIDLAIIDAGHFSTENLVLPALAHYLAREIQALGEKVDIEIYQDKDPFVII
ncbi:MAG TPA: Nif3-like dinuclear metal center hexameric protein [Thermoanaerobacterales bacterium]|nr:Nif3-like dinuclear metal center hexameric protein [Thermoanaerobacterales bacterium]